MKERFPSAFNKWHERHSNARRTAQTILQTKRESDQFQCGGNRARLEIAIEHRAVEKVLDLYRCVPIQTYECPFHQSFLYLISNVFTRDDIASGKLLGTDELQESLSK
jgi:hypothetical protein